MGVVQTAANKAGVVTDRAASVVAVVALLGLFVLVVWLVGDRDGALRARDGYRTQVTALVHQLVTDCIVHPDGSGECKPGTFLTTTTVLALP